MPQPHKTVPIERLDQQYRLWMEYLVVNQVDVAASELTSNKTWLPSLGPLLHVDQFAGHLLTLKSFEDFDDGRFLFSGRMIETCREPQKAKIVTIHYDYFALALASWTLHSRRAYQMTEDQQAVCGASSFVNLTTADIPWPFDSFLVSLPRPLSVENREFDTLLVAKLPNASWVATESKAKEPYLLVLMQSRLRVWKSRMDWKRISELLKQGSESTWNDRVERASKLVYDSNALDKTAALLSSVGLLDTQPVATIEKAIAQNAIHGNSPAYNAIVQQAWRIVIALCFELDSRRITPQSGSWERVRLSHTTQRRGESLPRGISDATQICHVAAVERLEHEERETLFNLAREHPSGHELSFHWRKPHYRAPWGHRKLYREAAEQTVHIPATKIRPDRKLENGVPGGKLVKL